MTKRRGYLTSHVTNTLRRRRARERDLAAGILPKRRVPREAPPPTKQKEGTT